MLTRERRLKIGGSAMARIKIADLPKDRKISREEMKGIMGGYSPQGRNWSFLRNPWVLGAIVTAAIAVPLTIADSDDGS